MGMEPLVDCIREALCSIFNLIYNIYVYLFALVLSLLGGWAPELLILKNLLIIDFFTGVANSISERRLSSHLCLRKNIVKFMRYMIIISIGYSIDCFMGAGTLFRDIIIKLLIGGEIISNLENLRKLGLPVPNWFSEMIECQIGPDKRRT